MHPFKFWRMCAPTQPPPQSRLRTLPSPQEIFTCPFQPIPSPIYTPSHHWSTFCHHSLVLPFPEFHINWITKYVVFCSWFFLLGITFLRFIYILAYINSSFLLLSNILLNVCAISCLAICIGRFGVIMNEAAVHILGKVFLWAHAFISLGQIPKSGIVEF